MLDLKIYAPGHHCFHPRPCIKASNNVFVNGRGVNRVGDMWKYHSCKHHGGHVGYTVTGSNSVYCNGKPVGRLKDQINCGSKIMTASSNVYAG